MCGSESTRFYNWSNSLYLSRDFNWKIRLLTRGFGDRKTCVVGHQTAGFSLAGEYYLTILWEACSFICSDESSSRFPWYRVCPKVTIFAVIENWEFLWAMRPLKKGRRLCLKTSLGKVRKQALQAQNFNCDFLPASASQHCADSLYILAFWIVWIEIQLSKIEAKCVFLKFRQFSGCGEQRIRRGRGFDLNLGLMSWNAILPLLKDPGIYEILRRNRKPTLWSSALEAAREMKIGQRFNSIWFFFYLTPRFPSPSPREPIIFYLSLLWRPGPIYSIIE